MLESIEQVGHKTENNTETGDVDAEPTHTDVPGAKDGQCRLLGPFAILVQAALGLLALLSLVWKRWRETPPRPLKVWFFDVSKQVFGSVLLHIANLFLSMLSSGKLDVAATRAPATVADARLAARGASRSQPNPCSFYLLNLAIDVSNLKLGPHELVLASAFFQFLLTFLLQDNAWYSYSRLPSLRFTSHV